jgi:predicted transcriptional regulator
MTTPSAKPSHPLLDRGVIIALISLAGTMVVAYLSYVNTRMQVEAPIHATQTAEAKATSLSLATASAFQPSPTAVTPTATFTLTMVPRPLFSDFIICLEKCNGFNSVRAFPEKTKAIHAQWNYSNIPPDAVYERTWSLGTEVWVKYSCVWEGPPEGTENISMIEGEGFHSGTWTVTIRVNRELVMQETVFIEGNWDYWYPPGDFDFCPASK